MAIDDQLGEQPPFDRANELQRLFDLAMKAQLDVSDVMVRRFHKMSPDDPATIGDVTEVLHVALAAVQAARQCVLEIHVALTGEPLKGA